MKNMLRYLLLLIITIACHTALLAQSTDTSGADIEELEQMLNNSTKGGNTAGNKVLATFESTRIINGQSIENVNKGVLDFRIAHRFGKLNEGIKNLYGLDNATTKFSFDYGITDWLMAGVGRSSFEKEYDGFIKVRLWHQTLDNHRPISVSVLTGASVQTMEVVNIPGYTYYFRNRLYYVNQLLLARKLNKWLSVQLTPTYLHYNLVSEAKEPNDVLAIGTGGHVKVSKHIAITGEYYYVVPGHKLSGYHNSVSLGVDLETGGHVFQLFITNSSAVTERTFVGETADDALKGNMHLGFNISRVFAVARHKVPQQTAGNWEQAH